MIINVLHGKKLPVYGDGLNVRDWLYVRDHASAIDRIIRNGQEGEIYNVGGHNERANIDVVKAILKVLGKGEDAIEYVTDRKGHDRRYAIDPAKIKREFGWEPETPFDEGIKITIDWYLKHRKWWEDIVSGDYADYYERMYKNR